jgi:hypothetical protein
MHELFKRVAVAALRALNQGALFGWTDFPPRDSDRG